MIVKISGIISNLTELEHQIDRIINSHKEGPIVVDLKDIRFMVSSATAQIVKLYKHAKRRGSDFQIINAGDDLYEMFKMLKLDLVLHISK